MWRLAPLMLLVACSEPLTQVVVRVRTDLREQDFTRLDIEVWTVDGELSSDCELDDRCRRQFVLPASEAFPNGPAGTGFVEVGSLGVSPLAQSDPASRRFQVQVDVRGTESRSFTTRVISSFVSERTVYLDVYVAAACFDHEPCEPDETCGIDGTCVAAYVPPDRLSLSADPPDSDPRQTDAGPDMTSDAGVGDASNPTSHRLVFPYHGFRASGGSLRVVAELAEEGTPSILLRPYEPATGTCTDNRRASIGLGASTLGPVQRQAAVDSVSWRGLTCATLTVSGVEGPTSYIRFDQPPCDVNGDGQTESVVVPRITGGERYFWLDGAVVNLPMLGTGDESTPESVSCGDFDGDGTDEIAIGVGGRPGTMDVGRIYVVDASGMELFTHTGPPGLGTAMTSADFDGDGYDDLASATREGATTLMYFAGSESGLRMPLSHEVDARDTARGSQSSVSFSDLDGDLLVELLVGRLDPGGVHLISQPLGAQEVRTIDSPEEPSAQFGDVVTGVDDLDGDGLGDFAVSAHLAQLGDGRVYTYRGHSNVDEINGHHQLLELDSTPGQPGVTAFGWSLADGGPGADGHSLLVVGEPYAPLSGPDSEIGQLHVFSNGTRTPLTAGSSTQGARYGWALTRYGWRNGAVALVAVEPGEGQGHWLEPSRGDATSFQLGVGGRGVDYLTPQ